jgi:hypothetical protein
MTPIGAAVGALLLVTGLGGLAYLFVWHPLQQFLRLRETIKRRIARLEHERARRQEAAHRTATLDSVLSKLTIRQLVVAEQEFHKLAVQVKSFAETQHAAAWVLRKMQIDLAKAQAGLSDLSAAIALERNEHVTERRAEMVDGGFS